MKKTIYFTGANCQIHELEIGIKSATTKRDTWLEDNINLVGKIDSEDIKITPWGANLQYVFVIIKLTYYPK